MRAVLEPHLEHAVFATRAHAAPVAVVLERERISATIDGALDAPRRVVREPERLLVGVAALDEAAVLVVAISGQRLAASSRVEQDDLHQMPALPIDAQAPARREDDGRELAQTVVLEPNRGASLVDANEPRERRARSALEMTLGLCVPAHDEMSRVDALELEPAGDTDDAVGERVGERDRRIVRSPVEHPVEVPLERVVELVRMAPPEAAIRVRSRAVVRAAPDERHWLVDDAEIGDTVEHRAGDHVDRISDEAGLRARHAFATRVAHDGPPGERAASCRANMLANRPLAAAVAWRSSGAVRSADALPEPAHEPESARARAPRERLTQMPEDQ
nr:hypothetical protein [Sandaracinus amylolyticus]